MARESYRFLLMDYSAGIILRSIKSAGGGVAINIDIGYQHTDKHQKNELMGKEECRTPHPLPSLFSGGGHRVHARDRVAFLPL